MGNPLPIIQVNTNNLKKNEEEVAVQKIPFLNYFYRVYKIVEEKRQYIGQHTSFYYTKASGEAFLFHTYPTFDEIINGFKCIGLENVGSYDEIHDYFNWEYEYIDETKTSLVVFYKGKLLLNSGKLSKKLSLEQRIFAEVPKIADLYIYLQEYYDYDSNEIWQKMYVETLQLRILSDNKLEPNTLNLKKNEPEKAVSGDAPGITNSTYNRV